VAFAAVTVALVLAALPDGLDRLVMPKGWASLMCAATLA